MKIRLLLVVLCVCIVALGLVGSADGVAGAGRIATPATVGPVRGPSAPRESATPIGPFSISGTVLDYDGTPLVGAWVDWGWFDPKAPAWFGPDVVYHPGGSADTTAEGAFSFAGVTSVSGSDALTVTAPAQPSRNARRICSPEAVGGPEASRNGFSNVSGPTVASREG